MMGLLLRRMVRIVFETSQRRKEGKRVQDEMKNVAQPYSRNKRSPVPIKDETHLLGPSLGTLASGNISFMGPDPQLRS